MTQNRLLIMTRVSHTLRQMTSKLFVVCDLLQLLLLIFFGVFDLSRQDISDNTNNVLIEVSICLQHLFLFLFFFISSLSLEIYANLFLLIFRSCYCLLTRLLFSITTYIKLCYFIKNNYIILPIFFKTMLIFFKKIIFLVLLVTS
jgi:hypothetical protein